jgi:hypothetical protein
MIRFKTSSRFGYSHQKTSDWMKRSLLLPHYPYKWRTSARKAVSHSSGIQSGNHWLEFS